MLSLRLGLRRLALALPMLLLGIAGCETFDPGNPLIGRWTLTAPVLSGLALGSYEFRRSSMSALGLEQPVDYVVKDDGIQVIPKEFGVTLDIEMIDRDTARIKDPITGGLLTLRRQR